MAVDAALAARLAGSRGLEFSLRLDGAEYRLGSVRVADTPTPVSRPTVRGGVYRSDTTEYRMRATVADASIAPRLTGQMLGPSTDFGDLEVSARAPCGDGGFDVTVHLTDSVQRPDSVELGMTIVGLRAA